MSDLSESLASKEVRECAGVILNPLLSLEQHFIVFLHQLIFVCLSSFYTFNILLLKIL